MSHFKIVMIEDHDCDQNYSDLIVDYSPKFIIHKHFVFSGIIVTSAHYVTIIWELVIQVSPCQFGATIWASASIAMSSHTIIVELVVELLNHTFHTCFQSLEYSSIYKVTKDIKFLLF